jgi:hypothetical protein
VGMGGRDERGGDASCWIASSQAWMALAGRRWMDVYFVYFEFTLKISSLSHSFSSNFVFEFSTF